MVKINNINVSHLHESIVKSGYPMQTEYDAKNLEPEISRLVYDIQSKNYNNSHIIRAFKLGKVPSGSGHDNFLKGIHVSFDLTYPQYFTPQLQRYTWIDIVSSMSKMHTITKRGDITKDCNKYVYPSIIELINSLIGVYNSVINKEEKYNFFMKIVSNLPMGFEMTMGISTNYLQLKTIYGQRRSHKLKEDWGVFCDMIEELPLFKELVINKK